MNLLKSMSKEGNQWLRAVEGIDQEILQMSEEATIFYQNSPRLLSALQKYVKELSIDERKHPIAKCAKACQTYKEGMKKPIKTFDSASEGFNQLFTSSNDFSKSLSTTPLSKLISFRDIDMKEIDQIMNILRKAHSDLAAKRKNNKPQVLVEAAEESLKKASDDAKVALKKFNSSATEVITMFSEEMNKIFEAHYENCAKISF